MMNQKNEIAFAIACVNDFAKTFQLKTKEAFQYLFQFKGIKFLKENYEIEHTLSSEKVVEYLSIFCRRHGGKL